MIFLISIVAIAATVFLAMTLRRGGYTQFPFFFLTVYLGWLIPQLIALRGDPYLPEGGLDRTMLMALCCLLGTLAGWWWPFGATPRAPGPVAPLSRRHLEIGIVGLTALGVLVQWLASQIDVQIADNGQWTGTATILFFLAQSTLVAIALSLILWLNTKSAKSLILLAANVLIYAPTLFIFARRAELVGVTVIGLTSLWFVRRTVLPRAAVIGLFFGGILVVNSIGAIRTSGYSVDEAGRVSVKSRNWADFANINFIGNLPMFDYRKATELESAVFTMEVVADAGEYNLGAGIWNALVQRYVPGQLVGFDLKQKLLIGPDVADLAFQRFGYIASAGSTNTGLTDSFRAFWFFGGVIYLFNARVLRLLYDRAMRGQAWAQTLYMCLVPFGMQAVTHDSTNMIVAAPGLLLFTLPVFLLARQRRPAAPQAPAAAPSGPFRPQVGRAAS